MLQKMNTDTHSQQEEPIVNTASDKMTHKIEPTPSHDESVTSESSSSVSSTAPPAAGPHDVLCGRGGGSNSHSGNRRFRAMVAEHQDEYLHARKNDKIHISRKLVQNIHEKGGRFLSRNRFNEWVEVPNSKAVSKTSQALREGLDVRNHKVREKKQQQKQVHSEQTSQAATVVSKAQVAPNLILDDQSLQHQPLTLSPVAEELLREEILRTLIQEARYQAVLNAARGL